MLLRQNIKNRSYYEAQLRTPPFPIELAYLWAAFLRLHNRRTVGMGLNAITWSDIAAFISLSGTKLAPWEIEIIEELDALYLASQNNKAEEQLPKS